ncbi:hypothetical protein [Micromonospora sp. Llam0]|uniref:hypothetical protein n=1 Tax=Micromonospora sp. Llam0 TaxID=2485143 RepID=UPI0011CD86D8|nr:hypothetical protein [Micromonospora sp. Llam0]
MTALTRSRSVGCPGEDGACYLVVTVVEFRCGACDGRSFRVDANDEEAMQRCRCGMLPLMIDRRGVRPVLLLDVDGTLRRVCPAGASRAGRDSWAGLDRGLDP